VRAVLRITLPVFVAAQTHASPDLTWHHSWLPDGTLQIEVQNHGTAHIQILDFDVQSAEHPTQVLHNDTGRYLLPGTQANWQLHAATDMSRAGRILMHGHSDAGDFSITSDPGAH
jgi:P pilus assembly chaperone PapD